MDQALTREDGGTTLGERFGELDSRYDLFTSSHSLAPHLAGLPAREREILVMRFFDDMTQTQIAARFGISQMHVSRLLATTLEHLRAVTDVEEPPAITAKARRKAA